MKYVNLILAVILLAVVGIDAAQDTTLDGQAEVRNPVRLKSWLEANAADAETRIAAVEAAGVGGTLAPAQIIVGSAASNATAVAVSGAITIATNGVTTLAAGTVTSLGKADTALQPNSVNVTNVIVSGDSKTNTIIVLRGLITSWTVTE